MDDPDAVIDFAELLALERRGPDHYAAVTPGDGVHLFGGVTFGLAARAAASTVDGDRGLHTATCQYVAGGTGGHELDIRVDRVRDGRQVSLRRVAISAGDRMLFTCDAWFAPDDQGQGGDGDAGGIDWQPTVAVGDLGEATEPVAPLRDLGLDPLEIRSLRSTPEVNVLRIHPYWARSRCAVGEDRALNIGALAFLSDVCCTVGLVRVPDASAGATPGAYPMTLNHTLWVHRPFSMDDWVHVDGQPVSIHGARGLASGSIHREDGTLVASFAQESMRLAPG